MGGKYIQPRDSGPAPHRCKPPEILGWFDNTGKRWQCDCGLIYTYVRRLWRNRGAKDGDWFREAKDTEP
jgi:hypothetical protein